MERPRCRDCELNIEKQAAAKKQTEEEAKQKALKRQRDAEERRLKEIRQAAAIEAAKLREYRFLDTFVMIYHGTGDLGFVLGLLMFLKALGEEGPFRDFGFPWIVGSLSMILLAELVRMGRNVADDIQRIRRAVEPQATPGSEPEK